MGKMDKNLEKAIAALEKARDKEVDAAIKKLHAEVNKAAAAIEKAHNKFRTAKKKAWKQAK